MIKEPGNHIEDILDMVQTGPGTWLEPFRAFARDGQNKGLLLYLYHLKILINMPKTIHQGRNVKRFREMFGLKQEGLAYEMGDEWNQKRISLLEAKEEIDDALLEQIAKALKVPAEAIKNFDEEAAVYNIQNNYDNASNNNGPNYSCTFNPIEKWVEAIEENKKLYTTLLKEKDEKIVLLERLLEANKK